MFCFAKARLFFGKSFGSFVLTLVKNGNLTKGVYKTSTALQELSPDQVIVYLTGTLYYYMVMVYTGQYSFTDCEA